MKSLAWIEAEHAELACVADDKHAASIRRLKQRIHRQLGGFSDQATRRKVFAAIDAWSATERKKA